MLAGAEEQRAQSHECTLGSTFECSFPHDLMHLIFLNACSNLMAWWTGTFKNINTTHNQFWISIDNWKQIGQWIGTRAVHSPASWYFNPRTYSTYLAEGWSFWLLLIAPYALDGILPDEYYNHLMDLIAITQHTISFDLTEEEVLSTFQDRCTGWVMDYE